MKTLANRRILLGVTGGIAAYKAAVLTRQLQAQGAQVRVMMTRAAQEFVGPLTFQALTGHPVSRDDAASDSDGMEHIAFARWADALLVAPATADFLAKLSLGLAGEVLTATCLANTRPLFVAPAMNQGMWGNPVTQEHIARLTQRGVRIIGPASGEQACGEVGAGRMLEPADIVAHLSQYFAASGPLNGVKVVVTAGPTREALDPVRFLSNRSSGKMGYAVARAAQAAGAEVVLVSGPTALPAPPGVETIAVESAAQMHEHTLAAAANAHILIATAAVADYRPKTASAQKIKKTGAELSLELLRNPDVLADCAQRYPALFRVGFAAETEDLERHARQKLQNKKLDLVAANLVSDGQGFDADDNALLLLGAHEARELPRASKDELARQLIAIIATEYHAKHPS